MIRKVVFRLGAVIASTLSLLLLAFDSQAQTVDICGRTPQIESAILAELPAGTNCASVDSSQLASITKIDAGGKGIILPLNADDFSGLAILDTLVLGSNRLTSLPDDLFDGLDSLEFLDLSWNSLNRLPKQVFNGLTNLKTLGLNNNNLDSLSEDLFNGLSSLEFLGLNNNPLTSLPEDLFNGLNGLEYLGLNHIKATSLPEGLFNGLTKLAKLQLYENYSMTSLPEKLFNGLTSLKELWFQWTPLNSLHEDQFDGLSSLRLLVLQNGSLDSLPEDLFDGLSNLVSLNLSSNNLANLPEDLFNGLTSLESLGLAGNKLSSLPEDLFDGLTSLAGLGLSSNRLTSLPENLFDHVAPPQILEVYLWSNPDLDCLPSAIVNNPAVEPFPDIKPCAVTATLSLSSTSISENGGSTAVTATMDHPPSTDVKIAVSAVPQDPALASDYMLSSNAMLTIAANQTASTGTVTITAVDNDVDAPDKTVMVQGSVTSTETVIGPSDVSLTITDDDAAPTVTLVLTPASIRESGESSTVTATLNHPSSDVTTVTVTAFPQAPALATDYDLSPNTTLTVAAGQTTSTGVVTITSVDNDVDGPDKTIIIQGMATNSQGIIPPADVILTITEDDVASITAPTSVAVTEGGSKNLPVALSAQPTADVIVIISGHASTDLTPAPQTLTFTTVNWHTQQTVTLTASEDGDLTNDRATLVLTASGGGYANVTHSVAVTIIDNDVAAVTAPATALVPEGGSSNLSVALSSPPTADVTLMVTGYMNTDLTAVPQTLTFSSTTWNIPQTVTLRAAEDDDLTDDRVTLTLMASGGGYADITHSVAVTITDDDIPVVTAPAFVTVSEGDTGNLPVALSAQPSAEVMVTVAGYAGTDLMPAPTTLIFTPTDWSAPQTVTLTAAEDEDFADDSVTLIFTASGGGYANVTHSVAVTITDNGVAAVTAPMTAVVPEGGSSSLPVALSAPPTGEVMLTISGHAGTDLTPSPPVLIFTQVCNFEYRLTEFPPDLRLFLT